MQDKLNSRERLALLFDAGSFVEIEPLAVSKNLQQYSDADIADARDGIIAGSGLIDGRPVCAALQNTSASGGSIGKVNARKIKKALDLAVKTGVPFIGIIDSKGARIDEGLDALDGTSGMVSSYSLASGVIPIITVISGPCTGSSVLLPALSDFVFMSDDAAFANMNTALVTKALTGENATDNDLGGAKTHMKSTGLAHFVYSGDRECIEKVKKLLSYLPDNNLSDSPFNLAAEANADAGAGADAPALPDDIISNGANDASAGIRDIIRGIADFSEFLEIQPEFGNSVVTCFAGIGGSATGIIATDSAVNGGAISGSAARKAARFIRFCDAFNIPLLTIIDTCGFAPGLAEEQAGIAKYAAQLAFAYAEATVPRLALVTGQANGPAYVVLCSRNASSDIVFAWPSASIGILSDETATAILYRDEIAASPDPAAERKLKIQNYKNEVSGPLPAARAGYIDEVLTPSATRNKLIAAYRIMAGKRENRPAKKHDNMPL